MSDSTPHGDERELRRLNRALRMLSDSNQSLIRITDESRLLDEACRIAVEGGYRMAWVGFAEHDERKTVRVVAMAGFEQGYREKLDIVWADAPGGRGPAGTAVRTGEVRVVRDIRTDPVTETWRGLARDRGYESLASLPLISEGKTLGVFNVYAGEPDAFDAAEIKILTELAGDLAFGLTALRTRAERERAEEELHRSAEVFRGIVENSPDLIVRFNRELRKTYVNPALCELFGLPRAGFIGKPIGVLGGDGTPTPSRAQPTALDDLRRAVASVFATGEAAEVEVVLWMTPKGERAFNVRYFPERDRSGEVVSILAIARDITESRRAEEALQNVLRHARTMVMHGEVTGPDGWDQHPPEWSASRYRWTAHFMNETAAQEVMPVALAPGEKYHAAWVRARHPEDFARTDLTAARAFVSGATSWRQEFRTIDCHGRVHWFSQVAVVRVTGPGRWRVTTINTDITDRKAAQEGLTLFRALIDHATDAIEVIDPETARFLDVNETACRTHGYTREEFLALSVPEVETKMKLETMERWHQNIAEIRRVGSKIMEGEHRRKDGTTFPVEVNANYVRLDRDYLVSIVRDTTERKRAEEALRASEARFRTFVDHATDAFILHDEKCDIVDANRQACEALGYTREELIGMGPLAFDPDFTAEALQMVQAKLDAGETLIFETRHRRKDGTTFPVEVRIRPFWQGARRFAVSLAQDITQRQLAEQALRESEQRFRQVTGAIEEVFWLTDTAKHEMIYISPAYEKVWGRTCASLHASAQSWLDAIHPADRERVIAALPSQPAGTYDIEYRILRPDGAVRWIRDRAFPVRDVGGKVGRVAGVAIDVTEQRQLEEQFRQAQKMEAVGQLAGGIAHDFNNLLTVIQLQSSMMLADRKLAPAIMHSVEQINEAAIRAANLTRQLLTFSRQNVKQARALDVGEIVSSTTRLLRRVLGEDISLESRFASGLPLVHADPGMLEQVLMNLVINSRDAMPQGGRLSLALDVVQLDAEYVAAHPVARPGRFVQLSVSDTGTGIAPENLTRIFEPFFTTKEIGKGTGLGLAMVFGIVQQHQGWIEAESEVGRGTTFRVFLPTLDASASGQTAPPPPPVRGGSETILLVEDEPLVRGMAAAALQRGGYRVHEAGTAAEALQRWDELHGRIDLLLTDLIMPGGVTGNRLAEQLAVRQPGLRIIFTSGYNNDAVNRELHFVVGQNFLPKPYPVEELLGIVRRRLDQP